MIAFDVSAALLFVAMPLFYSMFDVILITRLRKEFLRVTQNIEGLK